MISGKRTSIRKTLAGLTVKTTSYRDHYLQERSSSLEILRCSSNLNGRFYLYIGWRGDRKSILIKMTARVERGFVRRVSNDKANSHTSFTDEKEKYFGLEAVEKELRAVGITDKNDIHQILDLVLAKQPKLTGTLDVKTQVKTKRILLNRIIDHLPTQKTIVELPTIICFGII